MIFLMRLRVFWLISVYQSYIDLENEWIRLAIGLKNIILYLIFRYRFPNLPPSAYLDPPFIRFSENFPPTPYYLDPPFIRHQRVRIYGWNYEMQLV